MSQKKLPHQELETHGRIPTNIAFRRTLKSISILHCQIQQTIHCKLGQNKQKLMIWMKLRRKKIITLEVQMTSLRWMFIHASQSTKCPLYVSPFFNSTNCYNMSQQKKHTHTLSTKIKKRINWLKWIMGVEHSWKGSLYSLLGVLEHTLEKRNWQLQRNTLKIS
jgi:hypothetical protein